MTLVRRKCDNCGRIYDADTRNLKRGWGRCCCKSCAAQKREKSRPGYNPRRVAENNLRRAGWCPPYLDPDRERERHFLDYDGADNDQWGDEELGIHD